MYIVVFWLYIYSLCHFVMRIHRDTGFVYSDLTSWDLRAFMLFGCFVCVLCFIFYHIVIA